MSQNIKAITQNLENTYARFKNDPSEENKIKLLDSMTEICSLYALEGDYENFETVFINIRNLNGLTLNETNEKLAKCFMVLTQKSKDKIYQKPEILDGLFTLMMDLKISKPSKEYGYLYKSIHKFRKFWKGYIDFCRWWNLENFTDEDYIIEENSKMSIAESALIFYTKRLINTNFDEDIAELALTFINFSQKYDLTIYSNYYIGKLLLRLKFNNLEIRSILREFLMKKSHKPWGWHLMSKTFKTEENFIEKYSCLLIALNFGKDFPQEILSNIYLDLGLLFKDLNKLSNAKFFFEIYVSIKTEFKHRIPEFVQKIRKERWYRIIEQERPNTSFDYKEVCRNILRQTKNADLELFSKISYELKNNYHETLQWSKDWYETMED